MSGAPTSGGLTASLDPHLPGWLRPVGRAMLWINRAMLGLGMVALIAAALILTSSVLSRYFLQASTDWQDEAAVFCLVGATFLCGAFLQSLRGHVGIEAFSTLLPSWVNRVRQLLVDLMCLAFCTFFARKSWALCHEAWVDGQTTSSSWAPPLWIPYSLMSLGMSLLVLQLLLQVVASANACRPARDPAVKEVAA